MENEIDLDVDNKEIIIEDIMNMYSKGVYLLAYSFVKDQGLAEDISQEVFIKCYKNIEKFRRDASIKTWVYRITVNTSKDFIRKKRFRVLIYSKLFLENFKQSESSEEMFIKQNQNAQILHKVLSLPQKYREIVVLYYFQDLKVSEIGETLGLNTNTVKTRLTRGRSILKENLIFEKGDALNG